jgi:hypothetical protein
MKESRHLELKVILESCDSLHFIQNINSYCASSLHYSDAFDIQFGVVVIRLKEGLDISHLQGQGKYSLH